VHLSIALIAAVTGCMSEVKGSPDPGHMRYPACHTVPPAMMLSIWSRKTAMPSASKTTSNTVSRAEPVPRQLGLNAMMACDTAFRVIARRCLVKLTANHEATCMGDPESLHQMRIALTRLRTALSFFSPMVADSKREQVRRELKWLNAQLGTVRDLDVAIERLKAINKQQPQATSNDPCWDAQRTANHRQLARALRSARYRRLVESTTRWIESGPWSIETGTQAGKLRAAAIEVYGSSKLARWQEKLLKRSRRLLEMGPKKRHRLRLMNKKLNYSIGFFEDLLLDKKFSGQKAALKYLRKAQKSLGQLNDDAQGQSLAANLKRHAGSLPIQFLDRKREKRLVRAAAAAYRKLAAQH
jgi:CHAD domain-containing protein